ncbi:putative late blight resistance protein homolog R1B-17 [Primulina tabacum]|uniref:putative late blight resistance protein homolog R1B-17 n=1 Tax=Primulina tabacum TaxID=48773 RepID=UPI003F5ADAA8
MAAYAAVVSLMHTSEQILHPSHQWLRIHRKQIESLLQKVRYLQEFLEDYSNRDHEEKAGLEGQIAAAACAAEDIIESHVSDQILARSTGREAKSSTSFSECIQKFIEEMEDLIETKVIRIKATIGDFGQDRSFADFSPAVASRLAPNDQNALVGSDEKLIEIMDRLTGQQLNRQIIAIVGMGGIGKTTLAKYIYENPHIVHNFHIRAWVTISQNYSGPKIVSALLYQIDQRKQETVSDDQLGELLYKSLFGVKYLIVMDDMWCTKAWDEIKPFIPDNCNGSRILITTRLWNVAAHSSSCRPFKMEFLDDDRSWELLKEKVFGERVCPPEFEELGKTIAKNCGGLPLAIVVIGGLLAKSNKKTVFWEHVAENLYSIINSGGDENCLKILSLSYSNLPIHLKPCFLFMALAPVGAESDTCELIKIWVSEGILKPIRAKSLEEAANEYIVDLIDRNLMLVLKRGILGQIKSVGIHDLLRDLCLREARKVNFFSLIDVHNPDIPPGIQFTRRLSFHQAALKPTRSVSPVLDLLGPTSLTRSMYGELGHTPLCAANLRLLRVLYIVEGKFSPDEIMKLVNLRYLSFNSEWGSNSILRFTSSISLFWNLQTLYVDDTSDKPIFLPPEIWDLPQLRHLRFNRFVLPDPPCPDDKHDYHIMENLHSLVNVLYFRCTEEILKRAPNLKELKVIYDRLPWSVKWPHFYLYNLVHLHKLESLACKVLSEISVNYLSFPLSLKKLVLNGSRIPWEDMTIVGLLPNLEVLKLRSHACVGPDWRPVEGEFVRLKSLVIGKTNLRRWRADKTHFPILEHLVLQYINLMEIPPELGELLTLRKIELFKCGESTATSARKILEEQESLGNEGLQLIVI